MQQLNLQPVPSQTLTYLDTAANQWQIGVRLTELSVAFSFTLNGTLLVENLTGAAGYKLIPYEYLTAGNFVLMTQNQQTIDYTQFGTTQFLIALAEEEVAALKTSIYDLDLITATDFDPRGAVPRRYNPQGYVLA